MHKSHKVNPFIPMVKTLETHLGSNYQAFIKKNELTIYMQKPVNKNCNIYFSWSCVLYENSSVESILNSLRKAESDSWTAIEKFSNEFLEEPFNRKMFSLGFNISDLSQIKLSICFDCWDGFFKYEDKFFVCTLDELKKFDGHQMYLDFIGEN